jgi:hypothetical protein
VFSEKEVKEVQKEDGTEEEMVFHFVRSFPVFNWEQTGPKKGSWPSHRPG